MKPLPNWQPNTRKSVLVLVETQADLRIGRTALDEELSQTHDIQRIPGPIPDPGEHAYEAHLSWLEQHADALKSFERIVLAFAGDAKQRRYCEALVSWFGAERCWRPALPGGTVTLQGAYELQGAAMVTRALAEAEPWPPVGIVRISDLTAELLQDRLNPPDYGVSTGIPGLDQHYRVRLGEFTLVHGIPHHGKTTFMAAMLAHLLVKEGWRFAVFTPESRSLKDFVKSVMEHIHNRPYHDMEGSRGQIIDGLSIDAINKTVQYLHDKLFLFRPPDEDTLLTIPNVLKMARTLSEQYQLHGVVLDPWNEFDHRYDARDTESKYTSRMLTLLRMTARTRQLHVWVVAHPRKGEKAQRGKYAGVEPPPTPNEIADSAHFRNKPDNIVCIWRDLDVVTLAELHVQKIRDRNSGLYGMVQVNYNPETFAYEVCTSMP